MLKPVPVEPVLSVKELYTLYYFHHESGYRFAGESHDFWEIIYVDKGRASGINGTEPYTLEKGQIIFHHPNVFHNFRTDGAPDAEDGADCDIFVVSFNGELEMLEQFRDHIFTLSMHERHLFREMIEEGKQVHYDYNKYGTDKKLHKSSHQYVTPYLMVLHNQRYYLMAFSEYWGNMVFHRLDRITNMIVVDKKATPIRNVPGYESGINYKELSSTMPYMYTDRPEHIDFIADIGIIDQIIDWFGSDIRIVNTDEESKVRVSIKASPNAMVHWAMQYMDHVEITAPESVRNRIRESLQNGIMKYNITDEEKTR